MTLDTSKIAQKTDFRKCNDCGQSYPKAETVQRQRQVSDQGDTRMFTLCRKCAGLEATK